MNRKERERYETKYQKLMNFRTKTNMNTFEEEN